MKDQPKHTPGPWLADVATDENECVELFVRRDGDAVAIAGDISSRANARLIAAAPDLLEALRYILSDSISFLRNTAIEQALAAIAKAEGRGE